MVHLPIAECRASRRASRFAAPAEAAGKRSVIDGGCAQGRVLTIMGRDGGRC